MPLISLEGLNKAEVLRRLYNASRTQGIGIIHFRNEDMSLDEASALLERTSRFDYIHGRVLKVDLSTNQLDPWLYDRDNGNGSAEAVIQALLEELTEPTSVQEK